MSLGKTLGSLGCIVGKGILAGLAGTAAISVSRAVGMNLTGREPSSTPARAVEKVLGIKAVDDEHEAQFSNMVHWGYGTSWGRSAAFSVCSACKALKRASSMGPSSGARQRCCFRGSKSPHRPANGRSKCI